MSISISACLMGVRCRHDGSHCLAAQALKLIVWQQVVPFYREQLEGLHIPRCAADIFTGQGEAVLAGRA